MDFGNQLLISGMSIEELDALIQRAKIRRAHVENRTVGLESIRKEIFSRIVQSGYSLEEIFDGTGRFPQGMLKKIVARSQAT